MSYRMYKNYQSVVSVLLRSHGDRKEGLQTFCPHIFHRPVRLDLVMAQEVKFLCNHMTQYDGFMNTYLFSWDQQVY